MERKYSDSWLLLLIVLLAATAPAFSMFKVAPVMENVIADFKMNSAQAGLISTSFSLVPIILSIPVGVIVSKYGNWKFGLLSLFFVIIGSALCAVTDGMPVLLGGRVIEGAGMALIGTVGPNIVNAIFRPEKRGVAMGIFMCYISLGQAFINKLAAPLTSAFGSWRGVWWFITVYAIVFIILWFLFLKKADAPADAGQIQKLSIGSALGNSSMWFLCFAMFFFMMAVQGILMFYTSFFVQVKGLDAGYAAGITGYHGLIGCVGAVVSGMIMDKLHTRKYFGIVVMIAAAVLFALMQVFPANLAIVQVLLVGFTVNLFPPIIFSAMPEVCDQPADIPVSIGVANTGMNFGSFVAGILFGMLIDRAGWNGAFMYMIAMAVACAVCMLLVRKLKR